MKIDNTPKELSVGEIYSSMQIREFIKHYGGLIVSEDIVNIGNDNDQITVEEITELYHYPFRNGFVFSNEKIKTYRLSKI